MYSYIHNFWKKFKTERLHDGLPERGKERVRALYAIESAKRDKERDEKNRIPQSIPYKSKIILGISLIVLTALTGYRARQLYESVTTDKAEKTISQLKLEEKNPKDFVFNDYSNELLKSLVSNTDFLLRENKRTCVERTKCYEKIPKAIKEDFYDKNIDNYLWCHKEKKASLEKRIQCIITKAQEAAENSQGKPLNVRVY